MRGYTHTLPGNAMVGKNRKCGGGHRHAINIVDVAGGGGGREVWGGHFWRITKMEVK